MKLKSLLLGSAAVLVAGSAAKAADAIVVQPEPVEYVRVCDAYGAGWWYIPGTETCLKIDGDVRVDYAVYHFHDGYSATSNHERSLSWPLQHPRQQRNRIRYVVVAYSLLRPDQRLAL